MLQGLINKDVRVRLKWGEAEYKGTLISVDSYMNLQLSNTEEFISNKPTAVLGQVLIRWLYLVFLALRIDLLTVRSRCNNVLWISSANPGGDEDTGMKD